MSDGGVWDNSPVIGENVYAQRVGEGERTKFEQTPMMLVDHEDVAKHMIGESLPMPADSLVEYSGPFLSGTNTLSSPVPGVAGKSPIPARADHRHDVSALYSVYTVNNKYCAPGQTFIDGFAWALGNRDLRVGGTQIFDFPVEGTWLIVANVQNSRDGGGDFTGQMEMKTWFSNGGYNRGVWNQRIAGATTHPAMFWSFADATSWQKPYASSNNVQFSYAHNDSVGHYVTFTSLTLVRLGSLYT